MASQGAQEWHWHGAAAATEPGGMAKAKAFQQA